MSRIGLYGENSIEYVNLLLDIWNKGDCAVLLDCRMPINAVVEIMREAGVCKCYIEKKLLIQQNDIEPIDRKKFIEYERQITDSVTFLPSKTYDKFQDSYSYNEAVVLYSSGTTGKAKGVILSHYAINVNANAIIDYMKLQKDDCMYICKPFSHASTLIGELLVALKKRVKLLVASTIVPPRFVLSKLVEYNVTIICVNPTLLEMYAKEHLRKKYNLSNLKSIYVSGAILSDFIYKLAHESFCNINIYNVYGLSEAGTRVTAQRKNCCKYNSVGRAIKGVEVIIVNEDGSICAPGTRGIVYVKTPSKFTGYVVGEKNYQSGRNDWLNTGDIGYFDNNSELHIVGRIDDVIIMNSHKIYPSEVEKKIINYTSINKCVVTLINFLDHELIGCLYVGEDINLAEIRDELRHRLLLHEIPQLFVKCDELPLNFNGKILIADVKNILLEHMYKTRNNRIKEGRLFK